MVIRNPHLKEAIKNSTRRPLEHKGYSFDYWAKQAKKPALTKKQLAMMWLKRSVIMAVLLVAFAIISTFAVRWQNEDRAAIDCTAGVAQKSSNSMLAFGGCKRR